MVFIMKWGYPFSTYLLYICSSYSELKIIYAVFKWVPICYSYIEAHTVCVCFNVTRNFLLIFNVWHIRIIFITPIFDFAFTLTYKLLMVYFYNSDLLHMTLNWIKFNLTKKLHQYDQYMCTPMLEEEICEERMACHKIKQIM